MSSSRQTCSLRLVLALGAAHVAPAFAETPNEKKADALYTEGNGLFQRGRYEDALKRLEESQALDPGTGTLIMLASCNEKLGRWGRAYRAFRDARTQSLAQHKDDRVKYADERLEVLRDKVIMLVVTRAGSAPGERLLINDAPYMVTAGDEGMLLELGEHRLLYEAPDHLSQRLFLSGLKGIQRVVLPALQMRPTASSKLLGAAETKGGVPTWAWLVGSAGVVTLGVAGAVQLGALSDARVRDDACKEGNALLCASAHKDAARAELTAIVLASTGVVLTGAGIYGILTAPPKTEASAAVRLSPWLGTTNGVQVSGSW